MADVDGSHDNGRYLDPHRVRCVDWQTLGTTFVTIAVLMDPVGIAPVFVAMTHALDAPTRRRAAIARVFGLLLSAFAVQLIVNGVQGTLDGA